jgi:hypothetical protein
MVRTFKQGTVLKNIHQPQKAFRYIETTSVAALKRLNPF